MSSSHSRKAAQNFAEFAQNLEICTPKLEKTIVFKKEKKRRRKKNPTFQVFLAHFLAQVFFK